MTTTILVGSEEAILKYIRENDPQLQDTFGHNGRIVRTHGYDVIYNERWYEAEIMEMSDYSKQASTRAVIDELIKRCTPRAIAVDTPLPFDELPSLQPLDKIEEVWRIYKQPPVTD